MHLHETSQCGESCGINELFNEILDCPLFPQISPLETNGSGLPNRRMDRWTDLFLLPSFPMMQILRGNGMVAMFHKHGKHVS